jgi:glutathione synthase/RimK-type ligase-like ATP-grasp enzyme
VILIISSPGDEHAAAVMAELDRHGARATLLDLSRFPLAMRLEIGYRSGSLPRYQLAEGDRPPLNLDKEAVVWWRRPQAFSIPSVIRRETHRGFAYNEASEAFAGLWQAIDAFWVNHPSRDDAAGRKVYQLRVAQEVNLRIPETLITNDPNAARQFLARQQGRRTVFKAFSATAAEWRETRVVTDQELAVLDNVRHAPVIFQGYIPAGVDLRVTVVGDEIFPAAIATAASSYEFDFRMDMMRVPVTAAQLPADVEAGVRALMRRLGLVYGAIDMRVTPQGEHVFLEINPAGQWLFIEARTGQPITATLARLLAENDAARRSGSSARQPASLRTSEKREEPASAGG